MTELLQQVITEIKKLPPQEQDAIATRILAELKDEQGWTACFNTTTDEQWDRLTEAVQREIATGDTISLGDVFPPGTSQP